MAWTYDGSPFLSPVTGQSLIDSVRFLVGDTVTSDPQLQDGEITGLLCQNSSNPMTSGFPIANVAYDPYEAAVQGCITLAARYTRQASKSVGDLSIQSSGIAKAYLDLIPRIRSQALRQHAPTVYAGGISLGDMEVDEEDDDLNQPNFSIGMGDNPDTDSPINGGGFTQAVPSG